VDSLRPLEIVVSLELINKGYKMQMILIALVWSGMVACSGITIKTHGSDIVEREPSSTEEKRDTSKIVVPEYCFDENGIQLFPPAKTSTRTVITLLK